MREPAPIVELDEDPTPKGAEAFWFQATDGTRLRGAICPPKGKAKGSILLLPGRTEYVEKYFEFIREMNAKGFCVAAIDLRGQGLSDRLLPDPLPGHVGSFTDYATDVETMWELIEQDMAEPRYLMAHSMGGAIAADIARRGNIKFAKMICCAPMLGFAKDSKFMNIAIRLLSTLGLKGIVPPGLSGGGALDPEAAKVLTSDEKRFARDIARNTKQPKLQLAGPSIGWLHAAIKLHRSLQGPSGYQNIQIPVHYTYAGKEALVSNPAIIAACEQMQDATCVKVDDALHEIFQERDELRTPFIASIITQISA
ncbi:Lysophospholipase L2 [hydrothermal vent metagenome]|uniref:Lysophospholipase L2 n=1 Tax=hydrothermal vent metagenome TaxID=652676 RepID=A0A3B0SBQ0_9ZZZZ